MRGMLERLLEEAYQAGFSHGIKARKQDEPEYNRMRRERKILADKFYLMEKEYYENRYRPTSKAGIY